ncbi:MAG: hypothetical protein AAF616_07015 [Bacteroidota bacterium]
MHIRIKTQVGASLKSVKDGFTKDLFVALNPPFPPVKVLQFDGCKKGDQVSLFLNFFLFKQKWISVITEDEETHSEWFFVDRGETLPFFLKKWEHRHIVQQDGNTTYIIDDITFSTGTILTDLLFYPAMLAQFAYRKPVYQKIFAAQPAVAK